MIRVISQEDSKTSPVSSEESMHFCFLAVIVHRAMQEQQCDLHCTGGQHDAAQRKAATPVCWLFHRTLLQ